MEFHLLYFLLSVLGLLIATYTDLKERIIPNKLTYGLIVGGLLLHGLESYFYVSYLPFLFAVGTTIVGFAFAYALWKAGAWAGGDVKMFTALAALNPLNYFFLGGLLNLQVPLFTPVELPIFPLTLFIFSLFAMLPYAMIISFTGLVKQPRLKKEVKDKFFEDLPLRLWQAVELAVLVVGFRLLLALLNVNLTALVYWFAAVLVLVLIRKFPASGQAGLAVLIFAGVLWQQGLAGLELIAWRALTLIFVFIILKFLIQLMAINKKALRFKKKVLALEDGDIVAETVVWKQNKVEIFKGLEMAKLIKYFRENNVTAIMQSFSPQGEVLADSRSAGGVTLEQIKRLKQLVKQGKLKDEISLKKSAPLAPAILIGYLALSLVGDLLWNFLF